MIIARGYNAKEDLPAKENTAEAGTWISEENGHAGRTGGLEGAAAQGPQAVDRGISWDCALSVETGEAVMRSQEHLTRSQQFARVYSRGGTWVSHLLVLRALPNELNHSRYGFSISKRVGNAVTRNRIKRQLREIMRQAPLEPAWDIVFIVRPRAAAADYSALNKAAESLLKKAGLMRTGNGDYSE